MNFKRKMVVVAMSTLLGQGAMAFEAVRVGAEQVYDGTTLRRIDVFDLGAAIKSNPAGKFALEVDKADNLTRLAETVNLIKDGPAFKGDLAIKLNDTHYDGLGNTLRSVFTQVPNANLSLYVASDVPQLAQFAMLDEVRKGLAAVPDATLTLDGNLSKNDITKWFVASPALTAQVTLGPTFTATLGEEEARRFMMEAKVGVTVPGTVGLTAKYLPKPDKFQVSDWRSKRTAILDGFTFARAKAMMSLDSAPASAP